MTARSAVSAPIVAMWLSVLAGCSGSSRSPPPFSCPAAAEVVHVTDPFLVATTTWAAGRVYAVDTTVHVRAPLTVEPCAIVKFAGGTGLNVDADGGRIVANGGSAASPIVFTSELDDAAGWDTNEDGTVTTPAPGSWRGITVQRDGSVFDHCVFRYGGATNGAMLAVTNASAARITGSAFTRATGSFSDLRGAAVNLAGAGPGTVLTGNAFHGNVIPLVIGEAVDVDDTNVFHDPAHGSTVTNRYDGIFWDGNYLLTGHRTWSNTDAPFVVAGGPVAIPAGATLTIGDRVVVKFAAGERIEVTEGALLARGAAGIVFTSLNDDLGGDSNGDGAASAPAPGDWLGIAVSADGSTFDRCRFSYAGSAAPYSGALAVRAGSAATITRCTFSHNAGGTPADSRAAALNLGSAARGSVVTGNLFYANDLPVVVNGIVEVGDTNVFHLDPAGAPSVGNTYDGIFVDGVFHAVHGAVTWSNREVPYVLYDTTLGIGSGDVADPGHLTLGPGVVVKLWGGFGRIDVYEYGELTQSEANGNWFTSLADDARLGDTAGDGPTSGAAGDWAGVNLCTPGCAWASWGNVEFAAHPP